MSESARSLGALAFALAMIGTFPTDRCSQPPPGATPPPTTTTTTTTTTTLPAPAPTPTPTPAPTPTPTPTPAPGGCPLTVGDVDRYEVRVKPQGGRQLDVTVWAYGPRVVAALQSCSSSGCPLALEKGHANGACALALYGAPLWMCEGCDGYPRDNLFTFKLLDCAGTCTIGPSVEAALRLPGVLRELTIVRGVPACNVDASGRCK